MRLLRQDRLFRKPAPAGARALTLTEIMASIAIIGIITAISVPAIGNLFDGTDETAVRENARRIETVSAALAGMGIAHVIPESMGGVDATIKLLREGVTVSNALFESSVYSVPGLEDRDINRIAGYLEIYYDQRARLRYNPNA